MRVKVCLSDVGFPYIVPAEQDGLYPVRLAEFSCSMHNTDEDSRIAAWKAAKAACDGMNAADLVLNDDDRGAYAEMRAERERRFREIMAEIDAAKKAGKA